ncbi:uncharacterized protein [Tiliqua scincoides]|uniref:uncharacterized protein n=1 Tax=Tiliqua scincoides TaxID=71010 RepID=UPI0034636472
MEMVRLLPGEAAPGDRRVIRTARSYWPRVPGLPCPPAWQERTGCSPALPTRGAPACWTRVSPAAPPADRRMRTTGGALPPLPLGLLALLALPGAAPAAGSRPGERVGPDRGSSGEGRVSATRPPHRPAPAPPRWRGFQVCGGVPGASWRGGRSGHLHLRRGAEDLGPGVEGEGGAAESGGRGVAVAGAAPRGAWAGMGRAWRSCPFRRGVGSGETRHGKGVWTWGCQTHLGAELSQCSAAPADSQPLWSGAGRGRHLDWCLETRCLELGPLAPLLSRCRGGRGSLAVRPLSRPAHTLSPPSVEDTYVELDFFQESFPSQKQSGEYLQERNEDEIFHVDWDRKETVWRLPDFTTYSGFDAQGALGNLAVLKNNLEIMMKRSNRTQAPDVAPSAIVYLKNPMELGNPNVLICFVDQFFPPVLNITWLKNGEVVSQGVTETDFYPKADSTFRKFSYLPFVPEPGDFYVCKVDHWGLTESLSKLWGKQDRDYSRQRELHMVSLIAIEEDDGLDQWWQTYGTHSKEPTPIPETLENVICALGLALGILGIIAGTILCFKARQGVAPSATVYLKNSLELGTPNVLICFVDQFFPPVLNITWLKNGEVVSQGVTETDFYPKADRTFRKFSYLPFIPEPGDFYVCKVDHWGLTESLSKLWYSKEPTPIPETLENVICALGLALGILGIIAGTILCFKARQGDESSRHRGAR